MDNSLPGIIITGASGFIGRHFVEHNVNRYRMFCIARRSQRESGIPKHENIRWTQADIGDFSNLQDVVESINQYGGADFILHLAGYYDFTMVDHPQYEHTNVDGTRNVLKLAQYLNIKRFIFSSSLAASKFNSNPEQILNEQSPPDATYPYARSKRKAEEMIRNYSTMFPCTILRFAAVYSDWCEYPPLFVFLSTWLSEKWNSRIIGGKGETSITYIHITDLVKMIVSILDRSDNLPQLATYVSSPSGTVTHNELYEAATKYFYGRPKRAIRMPKIIATPGVIARTALGNLLGEKPFERPWMMKYIDKKLVVDARKTNENLDWKTTPRNDIIRRLLFMIENMKNHYVDWTVKNETAMNRITTRFNIRAYEVMMRHRDFIITKMVDHVYNGSNQVRYEHYRDLEKLVLKWYLTMLYQLIATSIKVGDRILIRKYIQAIALRRYKSGFSASEVVSFLSDFEKIILSELLIDPEAQETREQLFTAVNIAIQLSIDEIEESFEFFDSDSARIVQLPDRFPSIQNVGSLKEVITDLEDTFFNSLESDLTRDFEFINEQIHTSENGNQSPMR
ncbi:MAG TPA: NAD(P)-dependent oxidoreductase [Bacteroides sp.]|nr:NAD(P)-dependent oxidoreductase [Bacteroides sp.]